MQELLGDKGSLDGTLGDPLFVVVGAGSDLCRPPSAIGLHGRGGGDRGLVCVGVWGSSVDGEVHLYGRCERT